MINRSTFRSVLSAGLMVSALVVAPNVHAADTTGTTCQKSTGSDAVSRLAQREDCLNSRVQKYKQNAQLDQQAREKKIADLKNKYTNAPANERAKLASRIQNEQSKLTSARDTQVKRLQNLQNQTAQQQERVNALGKKARSDVGNFLNGGL